MPEENNPEKKLQLPSAGAEVKSSDGRGGFQSAMALRPPPRKAPAETVPNAWEGTPQASPAPHGSRPDWEPEGWESDPPEAVSGGASAESRPLRSRHIARNLMELGRKQIRADHAFLALCAAVCAAVIFSSSTAWKLGSDAGERRLIEAQTKADVTFSAGDFERLNKAFEDLRAGKPGEAMKAFQDLELRNPAVSSLSYLVALAAMRSRNFALAEEQAELSIRKRERVSDSITIQALLQIQRSEDPNIRKLGDQALRSELLFRRAMLADPANPVPMIELAGLLRRQKKSDEAIQLLQAARTRVQPFDLPPYLEATIILATLQATPDSDLPAAGDPDKDLPTAISCAYISMRKGRFGDAAKILEGIRSKTAPSYFRHLMNDPALRPYAGVQELRAFSR